MWHTGADATQLNPPTSFCTLLEFFFWSVSSNTENTVISLWSGNQPVTAWELALCQTYLPVLRLFYHYLRVSGQTDGMMSCSWSVWRMKPIPENI